MVHDISTIEKVNNMLSIAKALKQAMQLKKLAKKSNAPMPKTKKIFALVVPPITGVTRPKIHVLVITENHKLSREPTSRI
ncbi:hypothetical protein Bca4012_016764 [Brassica carinata]